MKFICLQENLKKGLAVVSHINNKNINLPILNNILIRSNESGLELVSTNLEIGITHQLRAKVDEPGETTVDAKIISDYVNLLPAEKVEFDERDDEASLKCGNYKTKIKGESAKEFPLIPVIDRARYAEFNIFDFKKALSGVAFAVANNDNRLELSGVLFEFNEENLTLVATDSYRLSERKLAVKGGNITEGRVIVPARTVQEILRIISGISADPQSIESDVLKIYLADNQILFTLDSVELISRLINGQYPDYKQIIPDKYKTEMSVKRQDLVRALKASSIFSRAGVHDISLVFKKGLVNVFSSSGQSGESSIDLNGELSGEDNDITINYRYLLDGLNIIESDSVNIKIINNNTPCAVSTTDDDNYLYIVMPIRN
ncbi:DNA polymerase III subunit beta [Candidatus Falkowbacteria bacterium HGW-Falkowbacteria-2]|uniref:Beta sliding clamp n=1 Tax=Candidatus Falkowbacteria bacterium HGW-Falkowbacteria-2 TaxID=2013769 RepID=A0A2N2E3H4_9BACT|nr:MAG: DNA polymerase III subunit beta [Candidatus Falkowbacteria bacterium HGW-Falkowbacteria-2]